MALGGVGIGLIMLPILLLLVYAIGRWVFAPLRKAAPQPRPPAQFLLTDLYVLLLQLSIVGLAFFGFNAGQLSAPAVIVMALAWLMLTWWWYLGVKWLSAAKVRSTAHRALISLVAAPLSFSVPLWLILPLTVVRSMSSISTGPGPAVNKDYFWVLGLTFDATESTILAVRIGSLVGPLVMTLAGTLGSRMMIRRALASRNAAPANPAADPGSPDNPIVT